MQKKDVGKSFLGFFHDTIFNLKMLLLHNITSFLVKYHEASRSSDPEVFCRKGVLRNFGNF